MNCQRSQNDINTINTEITYASNSAVNAAPHLTDKANEDYWTQLIPKELRDLGDTFKAQMQGVYRALSKLPLPEQRDYVLTITCDNDSNFCKTGHFAHMNDGRKTMNLCDDFFDDAKIKKTRTTIRDCQKEKDKDPKDREGSLKDFRLTKCR